MLPVAHYSFESGLGGNVFQSAVFGLLHKTEDNPLPIIQTLMGFYFGYLTQEDNYSIKASTFLHHWWDVIALASTLLVSKPLKSPISVNLFDLPI